jgi:hypothetical protein
MICYLCVCDVLIHLRVERENERVSRPLELPKLLLRNHV